MAEQERKGREAGKYLMSECMALKGGQTGFWEASLHTLM